VILAGDGLRVVLMNYLATVRAVLVSNDVDPRKLALGT
jgi:hypothetical protein